MLQVQDLYAGYDKKEIVHGISFDVNDGEFVCIIGANGCGKTTVLKNMLGLIKPFSGSVLIDGENTAELQEKEMAKRFAYIPQAHTPPFPFVVSDVVLMGRTPYINSLSVVSPEDRLIAYRAIRHLGIENLVDEEYTQLSGGQQQLVLIARALAQQPKVLVMDEPTASLDFGNQQLVLSRMRALSEAGMSVIMVTHDPDHALLCADKVVVMHEGVVLGIGTSQEMITEEILNTIYGAQVKVLDIEVEPGVEQRVCLPRLYQDQ